MNILIPLPVLGEAIESATITRWLKTLGESVTEGEPLLEVATDKVDTEIESPATGVLVEIQVGEDEAAQVGDTIAVLATSTESATTPAPPPPEPPAPAPTASPSRPVVTTPTSEPTPQLVRDVNPSLRSDARPAGAPTGEPSGPALAVPAGESSPLRGTTQSLTRLRKTIASRMKQSLQTSAQLTTIVEVDVTEVGKARRRHNENLAAGTSAKLSYFPFIAVAALAALRSHPQINCSLDIDAGTVTYPDVEHLGVAVDTERGLFVPVIRDASSLTVVELAEGIADVAERTRTNRIGVDELSGGTFTITNTGSRGALLDTPIINQPQVAILGVGVVTRRPVVLGREGVSESIAIRSMVFLSLTYPHQVIDGADAARYLSDVKLRLERNDFAR